ncbi:MAG: Ig-like domain-containing protein, partial [Longimicrobiales bacterium]|nr:Ig-like domain-containing protein [Longimicrobiales bacterium]
MRFPARPPLGLAMVLLAGSCVSSDSSTGVGDAASPAEILVQPAVIPSAADASALPINRIRAVTARWPSNVVLNDTTFAVDPAARQWEITMRVRLLESPVKARVFLHLINDDGSGGQATQYSGVTDTLTLRRNRTTEPADVPLVRGPLANLFVTAVQITGPSTLVVSKSVALTADVTVSGSAEPTLYWTSLDESLLTIDGSTATGVAVGLVDVVATAGAVSDTATIEVVVPPVDSVAVAPSSLDVILGQTTTLAATTLDVDGQVLTGRPVTWASLNQTVATVDQTGQVTAVGLGSAVITATSEGVEGSATVNVVP